MNQSLDVVLADTVELIDEAQDRAPAQWDQLVVSLGLRESDVEAPFGLTEPGGVDLEDQPLVGLLLIYVDRLQFLGASCRVTGKITLAGRLCMRTIPLGMQLPPTPMPLRGTLGSPGRNPHRACG